MSLRIVRACAVSALALTGVASFASSAAASSYVYAGYDSRYGYPYSGLEGSRGPDDVTVVSGTRDARIVYRDPDGVDARSSYCRQISPMEASCPFIGGTVLLDTGKAADRITIDPAVDLSMAVFGDKGPDQIFVGGVVNYAAGGKGSDTVVGGANDDSLYGDEGDDLLRGGAGDDRLHGDRGIDRYFGEGGDDRIFWTEGKPDETVSCGAGLDLVFVKPRQDRPGPDCEKVGIVHETGDRDD